MNEVASRQRRDRCRCRWVCVRLSFFRLVPVLFVALTCAVPVLAAEMDPFAQLASWNRGEDLAPLVAIEEAINASNEDPERRREIERRLIHVARATESDAARCFACRKLALIGSARVVPDLWAMLQQDATREPALYALQTVPAPEAAAAIRAVLADRAVEALQHARRARGPAGNHARRRMAHRLNCQQGGHPENAGKGSKAWDGELGGRLILLSAADGAVLSETELDSPPVFDGMAATDGMLFIAHKDGTVTCLGGGTASEVKTVRETLE